MKYSRKKGTSSELEEQSEPFCYWSLGATTGMLTQKDFDAGGSLSWIRLLTGEKLWVIYDFDPEHEDGTLDQVAQVVLGPNSVM